MNFADLKVALKSHVAPVYLVFGSDSFLVHKAIEMICDAVSVSDTTLDICRLDEGVASDAIVSACSTVSFFASSRVVIVRSFNPGSADRMLLDYLNAPSSNCVLIFISCTDKPSQTLVGAQTVNCNSMPQDLNIKLVASILNKYDKRITEDGARLLCEVSSNNFTRIDNEINKLVSYFDTKTTIESEDVKYLATKTIAYQIYELGNAVLRGDVVGSERVMNTLLASGTDEYSIFGNLTSTLHRVYLAHHSKLSDQELGAKLKVNPYSITAARKSRGKINIARVYDLALDLEYDIKSGKISATSATTRIAIEAANDFKQSRASY